MPPGQLIGKIIKSLVLLDRSTEGRPSLYPSVRRILDGTERIDCLKVAVTQIAKHVSVETVATGAGNDVDHPAGSAAVFRRVAIGDDLEFLHSLL